MNPSQSKLLWLVALSAIWILFGLFGHEPWKPDEAYVFGVAWSALNEGHWLVPTLAGEPFMEKPPLIYWLAALSLKVFGPSGLGIPAPDAARLSVALLMGGTLICLGLAARTLWGQGSGRYAVLALLGSLGIVIRTHQLLPDIALLFSLSLGLYALCQIELRPKFAGVLLGIASALGLLAKGLLGPGLLAVTSVSLLVLSLVFRSPQQSPHRWWTACLIALCVGFALSTLWPAALYLHSPELFKVWLIDNNVGRFTGLSGLGPKAEFLFYWRLLPWYALPSLPLALWSMYLMKRGFLGGLKQPGFRIPVTFFVVTFLVLWMGQEQRELYALPLLLPLALLAVPGLDHLKRGATALLDWLGIMLFGAVVLAAWVYWSAIYFRWPAGPTKTVSGLNPGFAEPVQWWPVLIAIGVCVTWLALVRPARRVNRRALVNWTVSLTAAWCVVCLLGMPYIDYGKRYRELIESFAAELPAQVRSGKECLGSRELGEGPRAMLHYYLNLKTQRETPNQATTRCDWLLVQEGFYEMNELTPAGPWHITWVGRRPGDKIESWTLLHRVGETATVKHFHEIHRRSAR